ncbi:conserved protein of unknown function [Candidatus Nitrosotalea okcheonensis]|uniref:Uncharacterized protein n=1 Tax=Candidatus Nitrosotalea okcheonensis TaxID=1903276 RepID=A0A2H1FDG1_9ARCH|nr:conserved protein of unknown function [Candidatus Nitrosotalea okcheonensis]
MANCSKCGQDVSKTHDCEHTGGHEYCVECYTELHYYLTEEKPASNS